MVRKPRERRYLSLAGLVILLAAASVPAAAQVHAELTQSAVAVGERVSYIITIDHEEPADVALRTPDFPGLRLLEGPTVRPLAILAGTERQRAVEVRFVLEAVTAGRYVLPAVPLTVAGQPYLTEQRLIEIGERKDRTVVPFLARWVGSSAPLHVGEARVFTLEIYNVTEYLYPSSVSMGAPQNAIMEEVQGLGSIEQYRVDDVTLYAIPVAVVMITPSQAGALRLPASDVSAGDIKATASPESIDVVSLPQAVEATGAVGQFAYDASIDPTVLLRSESTVLRLRVSGTGNLHFLEIPDPVLTGFQVEDDKTSRSISPVPQGYEGYVERTLKLRPMADAPYEIAPAEFAYLNPAGERVVRRTVAALDPDVMSVNQSVSASGERAVVSLLDRDGIASMEHRTWYDDPLAYGWLVPGLLVLVARRILRRNHSTVVLLVAVAGVVFVQAVSDRLPWDDVGAGLKLSAVGDLDGAAQAFERALRQAPDSPGINYDVGVLAFQRGDLPRAAYASREAIRQAPFAELPRSLLATIERGAGIERSVPPPHVVPPDLFFFVLVVLVNGMFVGIAFWRGSQRGSVAIAGILVVVLIGGSIAGLVTTAIQHDHQVGVVDGDVTLTRIPGGNADGWLPVRSAAAVHVIARQGEYCLVRTVLGLEGWLSVYSVIWPDSPVYDIVRYRPCDA